MAGSDADVSPASATTRWNDHAKSVAAVLSTFLIEVLVGTDIFVLIYSVAIGLYLYTDWLTGDKVSSFVAGTTKFAEYSLLIADTFLFLVFILRTTWRATVKLWSLI